MDDKSILALLGLDSSLFIVEPVINFSDKEITVHHFFAGWNFFKNLRFSSGSCF